MQMSGKLTMPVILCYIGVLALLYGRVPVVGDRGQGLPEWDRTARRQLLLRQQGLRLVRAPQGSSGKAT